MVVEQIHLVVTGIIKIKVDGGYHYHHGVGPHLLKNGVCLYSTKEAKSAYTTSKSNFSKVQANKSIQKKFMN